MPKSTSPTTGSEYRDPGNRAASSTSVSKGETNTLMSWGGEGEWINPRGDNPSSWQRPQHRQGLGREPWHELQWGSTPQSCGHDVGTPMGLEGGTAAPVGLEGRVESQKALFLSLKSHGAFLAGFWTCFSPVTPFLFPISPFWSETVYPMPISPLYFRGTYILVSQIHSWRGILAPDALHLKSHQYPI